MGCAAGLFAEPVPDRETSQAIPQAELSADAVDKLVSSVRYAAAEEAVTLSGQASDGRVIQAAYGIMIHK